MIKTVLRYLLAVLFLAAGTLHLREPALFLPIMPPGIPFPIGCILLSGVAELCGSLGLVLPAGRWRQATGWGLLALLIAVFPANIYMAIAHVKVHGFPSHDWEAWARLPLQFLFMAWALWVTDAWRGYCERRVSMQMKPPRP